MKARTLTGIVALFVALSTAHAQALTSAGDLDGDGRLDFIVESQQGADGTTVELWLSGHAGPARYTESRSTR